MSSSARGHASTASLSSSSGQGFTYPPEKSDSTPAGPNGKGDYTLTVGTDEAASEKNREQLGNNYEPTSGGNVSVSGKHGGSAGQMIMVDKVMTSPALPIACYCVASILMTVVNKFVVSGRSFNMNFLLLTIQSVVCVLCVDISKRLKVINFRDFDINDARKWFPISFLLVSVIYTGSKSLQHLSIPVYTIFKNLTIILIAYGEVIWFGGHVTGMTLISFGLMVLSSLIAAWSDISNALGSLSDMATKAELDTVSGVEIPVAGSTTRLADIAGAMSQLNSGYLWMIINCMASAGYVLAMRKRIKVTNFKDLDTLYYNNLLSVPVLIFFSLVAEDWSYASLSRNFPAESRSFLLFAMAFSGAAAVGISYTTAWCVRTTSSTTYSMVGALNKLPVAASGMIFFGDPVSFGSVSAITVGFLAGVVYAVAKNAQSKANAANGGPGKPR